MLVMLMSRPGAWLLWMLYAYFGFFVMLIRRLVIVSVRCRRLFVVDVYVWSFRRRSLIILVSLRYRALLNCLCLGWRRCEVLIVCMQAERVRVVVWSFGLDVVISVVYILTLGVLRY